MPSIILRHTSDSDRLTTAVEALGYESERRWAPGDRYLTTRTHGNFGFNLCLAWGEDDVPVGACLQDALQELDELKSELSATGQSLHGCTIDIGLFPGPETFCCSTLITATQCEAFGALGVDLEVTVYPVHSVETEP